MQVEFNENFSKTTLDFYVESDIIKEESHRLFYIGSAAFHLRFFIFMDLLCGLKGAVFMAKGNDLRNDSVFSLVLKLTIPAQLAQLVNVLYGIIDRMFIGHIPEVGDVALAGVGVCGPIVTLLSSFGTLVGIGGSIMMATDMGRGNDEKAKKILSNSFLLLLIFSTILTTVLLLTKEKMIYLFGGSDTTFPYANTYLTIYTLGTFFALLALGLNYFISCQGFSFNGMITVFIGAISNIILDAVFVFGLQKGVAGAALATVISQFLSCLYALLFLLGKKVKIRLSFGNYDRKLILKIICLGFSPFVILATDSVIVIAMNIALQKYGGDQGDLLISAVTITQSYFLLITGPLIGISGGVQPLISFNFGAAQAGRVKKAIKYALGLGLVLTSSMFVVSRLFADKFVNLFIDNAETASISIWGIQIFTLAIVPLAFQYVLVDALTALGRIKTALYLSVTRKLSFLIFTFVFAALSVAQNAFYAEPVSDLLSSIQSTIVFLLVFKKHLQKYIPEMPKPDPDSLPCKK